MDVYQLINDYEARGLFNEHLNPINEKEIKKVTADFPYIPSKSLKVKYSLINFLLVRPFRWFKTKITYHTKITGKENLKGIKGAIITSNHIAIYDCLVNSYALKKHKLKIVGAEFNNKKGLYGECMRAHGMIPISNKLSIFKQFNAALEYYLSNDYFVLIYPEESMWYMYEKPRPFKIGAFYFADKYNVPIIPIFITIRNSKRNTKKLFTVNIGKPVYSKKNYSHKENVEYLKNQAFYHCVSVYEKTYHQKYHLFSLSKEINHE